MTLVHEMNEKWVDEHKTKTLGELIALGQTVRSRTLALLGALTDQQLEEKIPGAPWGDSSVGGVMAINADHGRQHYAWVSEALAAKKN